MLVGFSEIFKEDLKEADFVAGFLQEAYQEGPEVFLKALGYVARAHGMTEIAGKTDLNRVSLYRALSEEGNPEFKTVTAVLEAAGVQLRFEPTLEKAA